MKCPKCGNPMSFVVHRERHVRVWWCMNLGCAIRAITEWYPSDLERILSYALAFYGGMIYGLFLAVLWRVV